jgi:hypothetical protein
MVAFIKPAIKNTVAALPIMLGVLMAINLINPFLVGHYQDIFIGSRYLDPLLGALLGSVSFGIPILAYVAAGELLHSGVTLLAVTAFILSWTTVGVPLLPLEIKYLGRRFALVRNSVNFVFAIIVAVAAVSILTALS